MASLQDITDYFQGKDAPKGYPYQGPKHRAHGDPEGNMTTKGDHQTQKSESTYGYKGDKTVNPYSKKK